ncbi:HAD family hydrolase [Pannonibacter sp. SL95]|jgi:HAD superfamily hydrolase (TIGR01509 family)|uniref:HAD family hydrolase n=1 Tax=Pannonibacter sp. SL95 TaxID=2995153 RepID=UPI0022723E66|nr:HAD family hydrolase [Pannonibacter sp. SL95]MCY1706896.1 HAD family hydrolase [Pannonibacter sp. SL95]
MTALSFIEPVELVIFDCDGVLIDSELISAEILLGALERLGIAVDFAHFTRHFLGRSFPRVAQSIREAFGVALPADFETSYRRDLLAAFETRLARVSGIGDVLDQLAVRRCVATSSSPERAARSLAITGLAPLFPGAVFTASEVANGKPAPDLFLHAASRMGVDPARCLVIEDSLPGLTAARAAGMPVLHFTGGSHYRDGHDPLPDDLAGIPQLTEWRLFFHLCPALAGSSTGANIGETD